MWLVVLRLLCVCASVLYGKLFTATYCVADYSELQIWGDGEWEAHFCLFFGCSNMYQSASLASGK